MARASSIVGCLFGGAVVYVGVACSSAIHNGGGLADLLDAAVSGDAIVDPVAEASAEDSTSGTRLHAIRQIGEDGSKQFVKWWDTARKEECYFVPAADGKTHCLPYVGAASASYFQDSACTIPMALIPTSPPAACAGKPDPSLVSAFVADGCGGYYYRVFANGGAATSAPYYAKDPVSGCKQMGSSFPADQRGIVAGAEIPASSFVAATLVTDP